MEQAIRTSSIPHKEQALEAYRAAARGKSNSEARDIAKDILGESIFWDWDREHSHIYSS